MAKVKYDVSKAQPNQFAVPKPDVYEAAIREASHGNSNNGNPMFTIVFEITKGAHKGSRIWHYILTDGSQDWRFREFTDALKLKAKGEIDPEELKGSTVQIRTAIDPARDGYDEKARIKNVMALDASSNGSGSTDEEEAPYEEWTLEDLREEAEARELKIEGKKTKAKLVKALEADDEEDEEEDEEEEEEEGEDEDEEEEEEDEDEEEEEDITRADLAKMSRSELKELIKEEELKVKILKKDNDDALRTKIAEALELGEDEKEGKSDKESDEEEEDTNYEEWDLSELKAELKERGLKVDGRKSVLVGRLKKDDGSSVDPF